MNFKGYTAAVLVSGLLLTGCSSSSKTDSKGNSIVASVTINNKTKNILADDLYKSIIDTSSGKTATYNAVLQDLVDKKFPITSDMENDADTIIDQVKSYYEQQYGDEYEDTLNSALTSSGYTNLDAYRQTMIKQIQYATFLLDYVDDNYDSVFEDYYNQSAPRKVSLIKVSVADMSTPTEDETSKLNEVKELLTTSKSFSSIATSYSDDTTASAKGAIGIVDAKDSAGIADTYGDDVLSQAQSLDEGQVSEAIAGDDGYYFVKVTSTNFDKLKKELKSTDIDSPLLAYDDYLQYIVFDSYKLTYKDKDIKKIVEKVVQDALNERTTQRGS